jgi:hypothetical protein
MEKMKPTNIKNIQKIAVQFAKLKENESLSWIDAMSELELAICNISDMQPLQTSHGIRKIRRGRDNAINIPAGIATAEHYEIFELWDGSVRLVPIVRSGAK